VSVYALLAYAVPLGLALLPPAARLHAVGLPGLAYFCGWAVTILVLFIAGVLGFPLSCAAWALCVAAAASLIRALVARRFARGALFHPLAVLPVLAAVPILVSMPVVYEIYVWDAWTNWVGWARQIVVADAIYRPDMWIATRGDVPGWPLAMALPSFVSGTFDAPDAWAVAISLHVALLALLYDLARILFRDLAKAGEGAARLAAWVFVLLALGAELTWTLLPELLLIEEPQYFFLAGGFLAVGTGIATQRPGPALAASTLLMAAAFVFKTSFVAFAPAYLLSVAYLLFAVGAGWRIDGRRLFALAGIVSALVAVSLAWSWAAPSARCQADTLGIVARLASNEPVHGIPFGRFAADVLARMTEFGLAWKLPVTVAALAGMLAFARTRLFAIIALGVVGTWVAFYAGVVSGMATCFSESEIAQLASVQRYTRVPLRLTQTIGIVLLLAATAHVAGRRPALMNARPAFAALAAAVVLLGAFQLYRSHQVVRHVALRENIDPAFRLRADASKRDVAILKAMRPAGPENPSRILYFAPRPDVDRVAANYHGLGTRRGDPLRIVTADRAAPTTLWDLPESVISALADSDAVVLLRPPEAELRSIPALAAALDGCSRGEAGYLLLRAESGEFTCRSRSRR
jgi:hypothetical protein